MKRARADADAAGAAGGAGGGGAGPRGSRDPVAADSGAILRRVRELVAELRAPSSSESSRPRTLADLGITGVREVAELSPEAVLDGIEAELCAVAEGALSGDGFAYAVPSRAAGNQEYIAALDRIVLRAKASLRAFTSVASVRKATIMTRVLQLVYDVLLKVRRA